MSSYIIVRGLCVLYNESFSIIEQTEVVGEGMWCRHSNLRVKMLRPLTMDRCWTELHSLDGLPLVHRCFDSIQRRTEYQLGFKCRTARKLHSVITYSEEVKQSIIVDR